MISEDERNQRLRDINRRLREILSERAGIEEKWQGSAPLDVSNKMAALSEETTLLRAERQELQGLEFTPEMARAYVNRMWDEVNDLTRLMRRVIRWLAALTVGVVLTLGIVAAMALYRL